MQYKTGGKSAGRVQSVALKLIVDREREILAFVPKEYWTIEADFKDFTAELFKYKDKDIEINNELEADEIISKLSNSFTIKDIEEKDKKKAAKEVFKTSTLQQMASTRLNFTASKTMNIAQKLYEGIDLGSETVGLITYMRTDSVRVSDEFIKQTYAYINSNYGKEYVGYVKTGKKNDNMQDGHEGIRPTSINRDPDSIKPYLSNDEYKLYKMIYIRALSSLMADAKVKATTVTFLNNDYLFKTTGSVLVFDGYLKAYGEYEENEDKILPNFKEYKSNVIVANAINKYQHFTKPASRYTESSLIKELESLGIGRPSTYATIISTLKDHDYVTVDDKKFVPTAMGMETTDKLQEYFADIINVKYTANMESDLDEIAEAKKDNIKVLHDFYNKFAPIMDDALKNMEKKKPESTGEICPECGSDLVIRKGKYGEFVACSNYPKCKYIKKNKQEEKEVTSVAKCPKCGKDIIERKTKTRKTFYGCSGYPKCDYATWYKPNGEVCKKCGNLIVNKNNEFVCEHCGEK
jgi:DNA topoisomerase-1